MNWSEIKQAIEATGIREDDNICLIQCDVESGDRTFHQVRIGNAVKLVENSAAKPDQEEAEGCAT